MSVQHDAGSHSRFSLPPEAEVYRRIGPFDRGSLPKGLLREHSLKDGTWAQVTVLSGAVAFLWDDAGNDGAGSVLERGQAITVPPLVPHHLEPKDQDFLIAIDFLSVPA
ncbi:DUF1971 domain-containing protein [Altererythrobacter sp. H2]|uniref:DUF1971 domain-containing protein n=1 Tax=Altererythrobacter sp. H2 TaxID=3108391 RepID=UPI002B4BAB03|nr:DUF1971 domain-containing protein [Altererythrobacter sp. H2]WRK95627.1 DUF1971 domain-containing protein [Altererythrobacter sp. H2]